jgi:hypothetical protein
MKRPDSAEIWAMSTCCFRAGSGPNRNDHRHSGIGLHTPADIHHGRAEAVRDRRAVVLTGAFRRNPERFVRKYPEPPKLPEAAWINKPADQEEDPTNQTQN